MEEINRRYDLVVVKRESVWRLLTSDEFDEAWFVSRPTTHQWAIDEILRHMLANEVRYLQMSHDPSIKQHALSVRAQWVGDILFRLEENHEPLDKIRNAFEEVQLVSKSIIDSLKEEDLMRQVKAPWGEMLEYWQMLDDLFDHDNFHRGQVIYLVTYFRGLPKFKEPPKDVDFG